MPRYVYECQKCGFTHQKRHPIAQTYQHCPGCLEDGNLLRIPSVTSIFTNSGHEPGSQKPGTLVKEFIEESKQDLAEEKKKLKVQEYCKPK